MSDAEEALRGRGRRCGNGCAESGGPEHAGMAKIALGQVDDGVRGLRRAIEIARENGDLEHARLRATPTWPTC